MRQIVFYRTETGFSPVEDFLDSLPGKQAQKVVWVLNLIEELERIPQTYFKKLKGTDDIWEIRVQTGGDSYRILCFLDGGRVVVLSHAFQKKKQKTPRKEIQIAERRRYDYLRRKQL